MRYGLGPLITCFSWLALGGCTTPQRPDAPGDTAVADAPGLDAPPGVDVPGLDAPPDDTPGLDAPAGDAGAGDVIGCRGASGYTESGPIVLNDGAEVTGLRISNPTGPCITGAGVSGVHIHDNQIGPCGITALGEGIALDRASDVLIDHNCFDDASSALYVLGAVGEPSSGLVFDHNRATNIRGPAPRGHLVQLDGVSGERNVIRCNESDIALGSPDLLDHISLYRSTGTAASPILVELNRIRGGGASGGGISVGFEGGGWTVVRRNVLIRPGNFGIGVSGGMNIRVLDNQVFSDRRSWTNVGIYVALSGTGTCSDVEVSANRADFFDTMGASNPAYDAGDCGPVVGWSTNDFGRGLVSESAWLDPMPDCE